MFDDKHYVPILKGKMGEFEALRTLTPAAKTRLTPVIDVPPPAWDYEKNVQKGTLANHLQKIVLKYLARSWEHTRPLFLDLSYCAGENRTVDGVHPVTYALTLAEEKKLLVIPTTALDADGAYRRALTDALPRNGLGLCVRINRNDANDLAGLPSVLMDFLRSVRAEVRATDLILDLRACHPDEVSDCIDDAKLMIEALPRRREWRTLTLAGSGFPPSLPNPPDSEAMLPRTEFLIWKGLLAGRRDLERVPAFGDYGIEDPAHKEIDPRTMRMSANLRYTIEEHWIVMKGSWVRKATGVKFPDLCKRLVRRRDYRKPSFSWGDNYISMCSRGTVGPGNATKWRQVGTNHHITLVAEQASTQFAA